MKRVLKPLLVLALRLLSRVVAPLAAQTARRGFGSEAYLRHGLLPVALHYYQPIYDSVAILPEVWERKHDMPGIDFREREQLAYVEKLGEFGGEPIWPEQPGPATTYYAQNPSFGYSSAVLLHAVVRMTRPRRVIEVGAGMSSVILSAALRANGAGELMLIDPFPSPAARSVAEATLVPEAVERLPVGTFESLRAGDVLFIDSSHVVRTGGDVNYLYLDVLPRLAPGVLVHIHDIQLPYEYPQTYSAQRDAPPLFWTEQYLLQAFLTLNSNYEVLLGGYWIQRDHPDLFQRAFPGWHSGRHRPTTSFYIRRC